VAASARADESALATKARPRITSSWIGAEWSMTVLPSVFGNVKVKPRGWSGARQAGRLLGP